jgi:hypothetical protein
LEAIPDFERGVSCGTIGSDIVGEFSEWEKISPIVCLVVAEDSKELFNFLVDMFRFAIGLGMEGCG